MTTTSSVSAVSASVSAAPQQQQQHQQQQANVDDVLSAILESPHFTVADYLNTALYDVLEQPTMNPHRDDSVVTSSSFSSNSNSAAVIHRLTELAVTLQLQTQNRHDAIHRTGMELQTVLPRCHQDYQRLNVSYSTLLGEVQQLQEAVVVAAAAAGGSGSGSTTGTSDAIIIPVTTTRSAVDTTTHATNATTSNNNNNNIAAAAMETLGTLHALRTYLTRTKEILIALNVWDTTINAISNYIVQENTADAVQCLLSLQQSEQTLAGMTEQRDQRHLTLHKLQQQVTTLLLQPSLEHALSVLPPLDRSFSDRDTTTTPLGGDTAPLQHCVPLYRQLHQFSTLTHSYVQHRSAPLSQLWFDTYHPVAVSDGRTTTTTNVPEAHPLVTWLPQWYQRVLHFIQSERQLCDQIFLSSSSSSSSSNATTPSSAPPTVVPLILIQLLQECFRPNVRSSLTSRLHSLYHPPSSHTTAAAATSSAATTITTKSSSSSSSPNMILSFPVIATLYESTIQFLSVLYESIVSSYMDAIESKNASSSTSTTTHGHDAWQLDQEIATTFLSIVSPFREYQGSPYTTIERHYLSVTMQPNIKAMQQVTTNHMKQSNPDMTVERLQETIDQLHAVTTNRHISTMVESTLQRYELFNGGYYLPDLIQMLDANVLNPYLNELSITIHTLSAYIVQNESSQFVQLFEEAHVSIALQLLLMIQQWMQLVHQLEDDTMAMIQRLYDRNRTYHNQEERRTTMSPASFQLPETLSMVEVNTMVLTKQYTNSSGTSPNCDDPSTDETTVSGTIATLHRWTTRTTDAPVVFTAAHETLSHKLVLSCHTFIFDVCYAIPRYYFSTMLSHPSWRAESVSATAATSANHEYGTLPQEYMTHIGEHMLALVQALEPFAMNTDYLQRVTQNNRSNDTSSILMKPKYIQRVVQPIWIDALSAIGIHGNDTALQILMNGTELIDYVLGDVATLPHHDELDPHPDDDDEDGTDDNHKAVTTFCNTWLDVVSSAVTGRLMERILRIPLLTDQGCEHVQADVAYIMNVLTALGLPGHPHPLLSHIAALATLDETVLHERRDAMALSSNSDTEMNWPLRLIQSMEQRFIAMRRFGK